MSPLVECVANVSEGRDRRKVDAIAEAVEAGAARVLDIHSDPDHHRSVISFAGPPEAVVAASEAAAGKAAELIDLRSHEGVHPRIGSLDVLPFVPLRGVELAGCAAMAVQAGERIWRRFLVPVFLYGAAARLPERFHLAALRREQPGPPDIGGPDRHPTAGAVAAGARGPLVAYNVNLESSDLAAARAIARAVRASSGGPAGVKALGLALPRRGIVQVSMNLTEPDRTPIHAAFEAVAAEAARLGIEVRESELVGLLPRRVWEASAAHDLRWSADPRLSILEDRLRALESE